MKRIDHVINNLKIIPDGSRRTSSDNYIHLEHKLFGKITPHLNHVDSIQNRTLLPNQRIFIAGEYFSTVTKAFLNSERQSRNTNCESNNYNRLTDLITVISLIDRNMF